MIIAALGKRTFDFSASLLALVAISPLLAAIAFGVFFCSPGPVFYRGVRTGRGGRPFRILKFRTMSVDAERIGGGTTALNDPRVYPFGGFLRRYKLDELPQLLNVLVGDMSLVGPRQELPAYTQAYSEEEKAILAVRPGITDLSSIRFSSLDELVGEKDADLVFETTILAEKNRLRLEYARNHTFLGDLKILLMTASCIAAKFLRRAP